MIEVHSDNMRIRRQTEHYEAEGYTPEYISASIDELEQMRHSGDIEPHAYLLKKQALVKLYLKSTTSPTRRFRDDGDDL